jgi:predicted RNA binding protein YcfA (HicA-like mRNA interferase family)
MQRVKFREVIRLLEDDGWRLTCSAAATGSTSTRPSLAK